MIYSGIPYAEEGYDFSFDGFIQSLSGECIVAWAVILILIVLAIIVGIKARRADPLKQHKGLLFIAEWAVEKLDSFVLDTMGPGFEHFAGLFLGIIPFLFMSFILGVAGLPTPMNNLCVPLSLALFTFGMIHFTSMKYTKWRYFKRYIDPIPIFLPINLLSMWAPLLSITLRMFGNAIVGWVLLALVDWALDYGVSIIGVTPLLHAYFDLVSGLIQTLVYVYLTSLLVAQERPEELEIVAEQIPARKEN
ncbi:MAG: F0F1 ATP synthase subunit A [Bacillales bacterium]|nr:F0F1 ATP synthase subunit A [Bacillales bacterium]